jgi:hypothetical protein
MTAVVPTSSRNLSFGNVDGVVASFTAVADTNTWVTGLSKIEHIGITNATSGATVGYSASGGTVTFAIGSGPLGVTTVIAYGFN